jgi:two-component system, cell cycle sensor histidine kinase and response regulator CckA
MRSLQFKPVIKLGAGRIAALYSLVAVAWIAFSDRVVESVGIEHTSRLQTLKGTLFVLVTAVLLYLTIRGLVRQLQRTDKLRTDSERLFKTLIDTAGEGVCLSDTGDRIVFVNRQMAAMVGSEPSHLIGKPLADVIAACDQSRVIDNLAGLRRGESNQCDCRLLTEAKTQVWALISAAPNFDSEGNYQGAFLMVLDISERKRLEEELRHSQTLDAVGRFAGGIAHDFNNLLGVIMGYASLLQKKLAPENGSRNATEEILNASHRAAGLIRQLLAFSRKQALVTEIVDVNEAMRKLSQVLPRFIGEDIELVVSCSSKPAKVRVGAGQIEQIVLNLAANARDAMPNGGKLTLSSTSRLSILGSAHGASPESCVTLCVSDNGSGMPPEIKSRIFEPFFTTKPVGRGTGLGLSTVYGIVNQNGGRIEVDSSPGTGTTFSITLPQVNGQPKEPQVGRVSVPANLVGSETILLVEDEVGLRTLTKLILESHGYKVLDSANADVALQISRAYPGDIQLLLTDMVMPGRSGAELATMMRSERASTKIAFMSGYAESALLEKIPGAAFIEKPVTPESLLLQLRSVLHCDA